MAPVNNIGTSKAAPGGGTRGAGQRRAAAQALLLAAAQRHRARDYVAARDLYRQVLRHDPRQPDALHLQGMVLAALGATTEGERLVRRSVMACPGRASFWSNLGNLLSRSDRKQEAIKVYEHAIELDPNFADARANQAGALAALQRYEEAETAARAALALTPDHPTALANLAGALIGCCRFIEAEGPLQRALAQDPTSYDVWYNLGHLSMARGRAEEAEQAFREALKLEPGALEAVRWLGYACARTRKGEEAQSLLQRFLAVRPAPSNAHSMLGHLLVQRGLIEDGLALLRKGVARPDAQAAEHSTLIFDLNYHPGLDPVSLRIEHERWARRFALPHLLRYPPAQTDHDDGRRLRVGFISPDFRGHSVSFFFLPLLRSLDSRQIETFCYAYVDRGDPVTETLRAAADHWHDVWGMPDDDIARKIREDRIDILVDLAGHTSDSRLLVLARRPAPVQASYLGYPNTTGMAAVDWRIVDDVTDPPGMEEHAVERLMRLDRCFLAYEPVEYPEVAEPPCLTKDHVTFGSFNNMAKLNDSVFGLWADILKRVPHSRLLLKHDMSHDPVVRERVLEAFRSRGVSDGRVELLQRSRNRSSHLETYARIDIALDPFPYAGTTTTCEALWMGVPVVTLAGDRHASRVGASLLRAIGLASCIARDAEDYVVTATELASAPSLLAALRKVLRTEMAASPLMDQASLGAAMTSALREMWRSYCHASRRLQAVRASRTD